MLLINRIKSQFDYLKDSAIGLVPLPKKSPGCLDINHARSLKIASSNYFNEAFYLSQAGPEKPVNFYPPLHYVLEGYNQGFQPYEGFDNEAYLEKHSLPKQGTIPFIHFLDSHEGNANNTKASKPSIILDPRKYQLTYEEGRIAYVTAIMLHLQGHKILIRSGSDIARHHTKLRYFDRLVKEPWAHILDDDSTAPENSIEIKDGFKGESDENAWLWIRDRPEIGERCVIQPLMMHPNIYNFGLYRNLIWNRNQDRKIRVFFSGENSFKYRIGFVSILNGMTTRSKTIADIRKYFDNEIDHHDYSIRPFHERSKQDPPILILDQRNVRFPAVRWLEILGKASFFLALPGVYCPFCHNSVECLAVGTIPIIEYGAYFYPTLKDGVHCLRYRGTHGMRKAIRRAIDMSEDEIATMRENVINLYDAHFAPEHFCKQFESIDHRSGKIYYPYESRLSNGWYDGLKLH